MKKKQNNRIFNDFNITQQDLYDKLIKTLRNQNIEEKEKDNIIRQLNNLLDDILNDRL